MHVIHTNLQFTSGGSIEKDPNRTSSAVFAFFKNGSDAKIFADYMWILWNRKVRTWDSARDRWNDLTSEQLDPKPSIGLTEAIYYAGWPKRFGVSTGLVFDKTAGQWEIVEQGQPEITAVFSRLDDAKAYVDFIEKVLSANRLVVSDDLRPQVVQFATLPKWSEAEDPITELLRY